MGYTITKANLRSFFSEYIIFSLNFSVDSLGGTTNIQPVFDLVPCSLKHLWCYRSLRGPYVGFQVLKVIGLNLVDIVLHITPQKKSSWVKSGDLGGQAIGPPLLIHLPAISLSRRFPTWWQKCGCAPCCWSIV
jgi:hypothetical protein